MVWPCAGRGPIRWNGHVRAVDPSGGMAMYWPWAHPRIHLGRGPGAHPRSHLGRGPGAHPRSHLGHGPRAHPRSHLGHGPRAHPRSHLGRGLWAHPMGWPGTAVGPSKEPRWTGPTGPSDVMAGYGRGPHPKIEWHGAKPHPRRHLGRGQGPIQGITVGMGCGRIQWYCHVCCRAPSKVDLEAHPMSHLGRGLWAHPMEWPCMGQGPIQGNHPGSG